MKGDGQSEIGSRELHSNHGLLSVLSNLKAFGKNRPMSRDSRYSWSTTPTPTRSRNTTNGSGAWGTTRIRPAASQPSWFSFRQHPRRFALEIQCPNRRYVFAIIFYHLLTPGHEFSTSLLLRGYHRNIFSPTRMPAGGFVLKERKRCKITTVLVSIYLDEVLLDKTVKVIIARLDIC